MIDAPNPVFDVKSMPWIRWAQRLLSQHDSRLDRLEEATGNAGGTLNTLKEWVGSAVASINASVTATVNNVLASYSTTLQMNTAISSATSGNITPASVGTGAITASGTATFNGNIINLPGKNTPVTSGYVATYYNSDGRMGATASSGAVKTDLVPIAASDLDKLMAVTPYWGRYIWDAPDEPMNIGTEDQPVLVQPGVAWTINEAKLVPALLAAIQVQAAQVKSQADQIAALTARLDAAGL